ncbi:MAG: Hsp20/alpha crystallin family protein, partial [bacterium]
KRAEETSDLDYISPAVDVYETEGELVMLLDMPGVSKEEIKVHVDKGIITITGSAHIPQEGDFRYLEFRPNHYKRSFELASEVDQEKIQADYKQGVLTIKMPKLKKAQTREITINVK